MDGNTIVERTADLIQTDVDGDLMALDIDGGNCFGFNATAARVWQLLDHPRSIGSIADIMVEEFEIDRTECKDAVIGLVDEMVKTRLVRVRAG